MEFEERPRDCSPGHAGSRARRFSGWRKPGAELISCRLVRHSARGSLGQRLCLPVTTWPGRRTGVCLTSFGGACSASQEQPGVRQDGQHEPRQVSSPQSPASSSHRPLPCPILSHLPSSAAPSRHVIPTRPPKPLSEPQPCSRCVVEEAAHRVSWLDRSDVPLLPALLPVSSGTRMWGMCRNNHLPWGILGRRRAGPGVKLKEGEAVLSPL